jgi:hypothetical protein
MSTSSGFPKTIAILAAAALAACSGRPATVTIPEGTTIVVRLGESLNSGMNRTGSTFRAETTAPVRVRGSTVLPRGATVHGRLIEARSGPDARMTLVFETIEVDAGERYAIEAQPIELVARSDTDDGPAGNVGGGPARAVIGGASGGTESTVMGGVLGAGAGAIVVGLTSDHEIELPQGRKIALRFTEPTRLPVRN